jgi:hypothetical protein
MPRAISYFGKEGKYIPNIKEYNKEQILLNSKKNIENTNIVNSIKYCKDLGADVKSYNGGASTHRYNSITNFTMHARL